MHSDPVTPVVLALAVILVAAKLGGELATRVRQPAVLGELLIGVLLGNLDTIGIRTLEPLVSDPTVAPALELLAGIGVLLLLFQVGLESTVGQMLKVGIRSGIVALLGVAVPFGLGWWVAAALAPDHGVYVHVFLGATLTATSVGITARVLQDLGRAQSLEARVILGAAVIDDVLGLVVLAVVTGMIVAAAAGGALSFSSVALIFGKAAGFLVGALVVGVLSTRALFRLAARLRGAGGVQLAVGLAFCFFLAWAAGAIGLAPIVGAFAAGLILEESHSRPFRERGEPPLEALVEPVASFLVPVFFVLMGLRTDLRAMAQPGVLLLAAGLTVAAVVGKQACVLGVGRGVDRLTVGIGMIPRGEVGLIFANIGRDLAVGGERIVDGAVYSAVVVMVIVTTLITPPALTWSLRRAERKHSAEPS